MPIAIPSFFLVAYTVVAGVMVVPPGVAHMDINPTLVGGAVGGALEVVDGALPQGEAVDPAHKPLQVLSTVL